MKPYELVVLLHPDLEIDVDTPIANVEKLIKNAGGTISKRDNWGKKRLAYPVRKQQFGLYVYFELELDPQQVRTLESSLRITEEVLRFLVVNRVVERRKPLDAPQEKEVTAAAEPAAEEGK